MALLASAVRHPEAFSDAFNANQKHDNLLSRPLFKDFRVDDERLLCFSIHSSSCPCFDIAFSLVPSGVKGGQLLNSCPGFAVSASHCVKAVA